MDFIRPVLLALLTLALCALSPAMAAEVELFAEVPAEGGITPRFVDSMHALNADPNQIVLTTENEGAHCGGGTAASAWKMTLDPTTGDLDSLVFKQNLPRIQHTRGMLFESSNGTLFTGGGWCGPRPPYYSLDGGETWQCADHGVHPPNSTFSYAEFGGEVYAGTGYSPWHAEIYKWLGPGGSNDFQRMLDIAPPRGILSSLATHEGRLFVATNGLYLWSGGGCATSVPVSVSSDGVTFHPTTGIPGCTDVDALVSIGGEFLARTRAYPSNDGAIYRWDATAETWTYHADHDMAIPFWPMVDDGESLYIYGQAPGDDPGVYQSSDLAQTWQQIAAFDSGVVRFLGIAGRALYFATRPGTGTAPIYRLALDDDDDDDGVLNDDDLCPDTVIPEAVPTHHLGVNRWALVDADTEFDTTPPPGGGNGPGYSFTTESTQGCSCEQIIDRFNLGQGHVKFGCSTGAILILAQGGGGGSHASMFDTSAGAGSSTLMLEQQSELPSASGTLGTWVGSDAASLPRTALKRAPEARLRTRNGFAGPLHDSTDVVDLQLRAPVRDTYIAAPFPEIPPPGPTEVFFLDTHDPANGQSGVPTAMTLFAGVPYRITVEGTFSIWSPAAWLVFGLCDPDFPPEPSAQFPSPSGAGDGPVGADAEFFFSAINALTTCDQLGPMPAYFFANFQGCLDGACAFGSPSWFDPGDGSGNYNLDHVYRYWMTGEGFPLAVRRADSPISDNYGQLRVTVEQLSPAVEVGEIIEIIDELPVNAFHAPGSANALGNQYRKLFREIDRGDYCGAVEIIDDQILRRINGVNPPLDQRDWVVDPFRQELYDLTLQLRTGLLQLAGGACP